MEVPLWFATESLLELCAAVTSALSAGVYRHPTMSHELPRISFPYQAEPGMKTRNCTVQGKVAIIVKL